ncbi:hypothetical protein PPL_07039 [Heterostelium album PN500]|uniref:BP74 N-terminal domain-containing protein n=1 Tax=Heterostelium pallidum (strain ATCC 26659 / Pp 5 / PN500) TaxID=670386 RepID=D3BE84_HETP5|nr:hypothetical protein PPL_07039 [Heterostelium album PN500]EFA80215.1 hypothetical protein PPL_07039 [Heterostelium album PN500]|eukprot:XP_020432335.1 hypothetical protein PPL_07039 [Heterostelium album PN500]
MNINTKIFITFSLIFFIEIVSMEPAIFVFQDENKHEFAFKLVDYKDIQHARNLINGETKRPHVTGNIVMGTSIINPTLSFHLNPESIKFVDNVNKTCDVSIHNLKENTENSCGDVLEDCYWCNGASKVTKEIQIINSRF